MSTAETWQFENLSRALTPHTPSSQRSVSDVPSLSSSCSSSSSCSTLSTTKNDFVRISHRPRGFLRPKATCFSDSARNRESVMSLGSITHIQHYFARTGLLDVIGLHSMDNFRTKGDDILNHARDILRNPSDHYLNDESNPKLSSDTSFFRGLACSKSVPPEIGYDGLGHIFALPPTTSTYRQTSVQVSAPPTIRALRQELHDALADAASVLDGLVLHPSDDVDSLLDRPSVASSQGWYEIEGWHILDLVTLAIRAAKDFYTCHDRPQRLYTIQSERQIRLDLHKVLDVLKHVVARNFVGGYKAEEISTIKSWILGVESILMEEVMLEKKEESRRRRWLWLSGNWDGRDRYREWLFMRCFQSEIEAESLAAWLEPTKFTDQYTSFLTELRDGRRLIALHNAVIQSSSRRFGQITHYHLDTEKPYRKAENLKFWIKAAELRWEIKLKLNVAKLVKSDVDLDTWKDFDSALLQWCKTLRNEITAECNGLDT